MDGILPVNKERGITSYDVIRKVKRALNGKLKLGHAGTLDPFATGVLLLLFGKATKLQNSVHEFSKGYLATAKFGFETDTLDSTGKVIHESEKIPSKKEIEAILSQFVGEIEQTPPNYSAVKVKGKKAYELAREGKKVELKSKKVHIHKLDLVEYSSDSVQFRIECSTGTYIRTLVADLGRSLGTYATTDRLEREFIGRFGLDECLSSEKLTEGSIERGIIPINKLGRYGL